jgi:trk system potassium uptake protein TrkA
MASVCAVRGGPMVGCEIRELHQHMPNFHARIAAIFRNGQPIVPNGSTVINAGDEVFFLASAEEIKRVMAELRKTEKPYKRLIFAGGGHVGKRVALALENAYQLKVIERDHDRAEKIAAQLTRATVLVGDATDRELLISENIESVDVFCALTNNDEANILSAMLAKRLGARRVISLVNNAAYVDIVKASQIDLVISPQQSTISALLRYIRRGDIAQVYSLRHGSSEAIEIVAHGMPGQSRVLEFPSMRSGFQKGLLRGRWSGAMMC